MSDVNDQAICETAIALAAHGYCWNMDEGLPVLAKDDKNQMSPITKAEKRILNGSEDSVESFYRIGLFIAEGRLNTMRKQQPPQET